MDKPRTAEIAEHAENDFSALSACSAVGIFAYAPTLTPIGHATPVPPMPQ